MPVFAGLLCVGAKAYPEEVQSGLLRDTMPAAWTLERTNFQTVPTQDRWWEGFGDATLSSLIARAVENNFDVRAAVHRMEMARQVWRQGKSAWYPQLGLNAGWQKSQESGMTGKVAEDPVRADWFSLGVSMNWEVDVFGKIAASVKADKAAFEVSEAEYDAVMVSLCSNLATAYVDLRVAQHQHAITLADVKSQQELLRLAETRYECGLVPQVDVLQGRVTIQSTQTQLPALRSRITTDLNTIALLCGVYPDKLSSLLEPAPLPEIPAVADVGVPADLLRRRPDVVEAEREVAQYAALAGVAKKDWLPSLSIAGSIGTSAHNAGDLFSRHSFTWEIAPTISWTIFDGMGREARIAEAKAQLEAGIDQYNLTVMTAVQETENAMTSLETARQQTALMEASAKNYDRLLEMQLDRYRQGLIDFQDLIDAQLNCLDSRNSIVESKGNELTALITLYSALGGGF